jgi:hypothetical protein
MVKIKLPGHVSSVSHGGEEYVPDGDGVVEVHPDAHRHGRDFWGQFEVLPVEETESPEDTEDQDSTGEQSDDTESTGDSDSDQNGTQGGQKKDRGKKRR